MSETNTTSKTDYARLFDQCCAVDEARYTMTKPFVTGEYIAAADGRIVVRGKREDFPDIEAMVAGDGVKFPPVHDLPWLNAMESGEGIIPPPPPKVGLAVCELCEGTGRASRIECDVCGGCGEDECERCRSMTPCKTCDATGMVDCDTPVLCRPCHGYGYTDTLATRIDYAVGESYYFADRYLNILREHGVTTLRVHSSHMAYFRVGDAEGLLMGRVWKAAGEMFGQTATSERCACGPLYIIGHDPYTPEGGAS